MIHILSLIHIYALEKLYNTAIENHADCVCANMRSYWKGIKIKSKYQRPCFNIEKPKVYSQKEIINNIYISCFGITDYPVSIVAKLYKTSLISEAIDFAPIVKFMGEDLSVTLRCLPLTQRLVIIPDVIYNYRIGGGTSKFMPYMLEDVYKRQTSYYKFLLRKFDKRKKYDVAVAFAGPMDFITTYVLEKVEADKKIQWIHFDVSKNGISVKYAKRNYPKFHKVFVVSDQARQSLSLIHICIYPCIQQSTYFT